MGVSWYMHKFGDYTAWVHNGDFWNFASSAALIPELKIGFWISFGKGADSSRDRLFNDIQTDFFPKKDFSFIPAVKSNSNVPLQGDYMVTRRPYTTSDKFMGLLSNLNINFKYDSTEDKVTINIPGNNLEYYGIDSYTFSYNNSNLHSSSPGFLDLYPYLVYGGQTPGKFIVTIDPLLGLDAKTADSDIGFLFTYLILVNLSLFIIVVVVGSVGCCCPNCCDSNGKNEFVPLNDPLGSPHGGLSAPLTQRLFTVFVVLSFGFQMIMMIILAVEYLNIVFGNYGGYIFATTLPILNLLLFIAQVLLIVHVKVKNVGWNTCTFVFNIILSILCFGNIIFCFFINSFAPRL